MEERIVKCARLGRELPGLKKPPFKGDLGQRVYDSVSAQAWKEWRQQSVVIINHYGLNMADPRATQLLMKEMEKFLFEADQPEMPDDWIPADQQSDGPPPVP